MRTTTSLGILLALLAAIPACGGEDPDPDGGGWWVREDAGVEIRIPAGFDEHTLNGVQMLADRSRAASGFVPNINVIVIPIVGPPDLDSLEAQNRAAFDAIPTIELDFLEQTTLSGRPVLHYEYHGTMPGEATPLHFAGVLFPRGERQVVVTAAASEAQWSELGDRLAAALTGMRIR